MAISAPHYRLFKSLQPILPHGGTLLEIGEANWYGDLHPFDLCELTDDVEKLRGVRSDDPFAVAKLFYKLTFAPERIVSIDKHGTSAALQYDLNDSFVLPDTANQFDLCINHGTAEHIFNIAQVFRTMHDHTVDGGLMIHESPFTGWVDHGFYCLQPTLFYDLAAANCYEIVLAAIEHIDSDTTIRLEGRDHVAALKRDGKLPDNAMLYVVYRKRGDRPFKIPMQGYYDRKLSESGNLAWRELR